METAKLVKPFFNAMLPEILEDVVAFLGVCVFDIDGLLLTNRQYSQAARRFVAKVRIWRINWLSISNYWCRKIFILIFTYVDDDGVERRETVRIDSANFKEALPLLLHNTVVNVCNVFGFWSACALVEAAVGFIILERIDIQRCIADVSTKHLRSLMPFIDVLRKFKVWLVFVRSVPF